MPYLFLPLLGRRCMRRRRELDVLRELDEQPLQVRDSALMFSPGLCGSSTPNSAAVAGMSCINPSRLWATPRAD